MIEPEMAFYDLEDNMNLAEEFIKYIIKYALDNNKEDLEFLALRLGDEEKQLPQDKRSEMGLLEKLEFVLNNNFERITYTEAIEILRESNYNKKKKFQYLIDFVAVYYLLPLLFFLQNSLFLFYWPNFYKFHFILRNDA